MIKLTVPFLLPFLLSACAQPAPPTSPAPAASATRAQEPAPALPTQPAEPEARRPTLPLPRVPAGEKFPQLVMEALSPGPDVRRDIPGDVTFAAGFLLVPIEQSPLYRKPDAFFSFRQGRIRMFSAPDFTEKWPALELPENSPTILLGSSGDITVFVQQSQVIGVDTAQGSIRWHFELKMSDDDRDRAVAIQKKIRENQMTEVEKSRSAAGMVYDPQTGAYFKESQAPAALMLDPDVGRNITFNERLGLNLTAFSTMRMLGNRLFIVSGSSLLAHDLATGKRIWKDPEVASLPEGLPIAIVGNDDLVVVEVDDENRSPTFRIFDAATGKIRGDIKPDQERFAWRGLSKNGVLFVVTDKSVAAYNCLAADPAKPLWRRDDIKITWAAASAITPDGLVLVDISNFLFCLAADTGKTRWPLPSAAAPQVPSSMFKIPAQPTGNFLRSYVDIEAGQIIYQTHSGFAAYFTGNGQTSWLSTLNDLDDASIYPLMSLSQLAGPYIVTLATGKRGDGTRVAAIVSHDRRPNKGVFSVLNLTIPAIAAAPAAPPREPPIVRTWQVVDNAIIFESMGKTYLYKAKPEK